MSLQIGAVPKSTEYLVIGSGFGGSVMAATLGAAGREVCLLERGKAYPPGSFPRTPDGVAANFWDPSEGLHGMFNVWSFEGIDAIVSSGLGGGSLIYANVMLEKDEGWFTQRVPDGDGRDETWSFNHGDLAEHYEAVKQFLHVQTMPLEFAEDESPKTRHFLDASAGEGKLAPLAVRFRNANDTPEVGAPVPEEPYGSIFGHPRRTTCRMVGECDVGCNEGAKSSMDHTYLSKAHADGASIHIRTEVRSIRRLDEPNLSHPFEVTYVEHLEDAEGTVTDTKLLPTQKISAKRVILAAGALGSTYLMLENAENLGLAEAPPLGERFCGNGDLLGFAVPPRGERLDFAPTKGPVITSYRRRQSSDIRMYLEDGGFPVFLTWLMKGVDAPGALGRLTKQGLKYWWARITGTANDDVSAEASEIVGGSSRSARSLPILGMGIDVPDGRLEIKRNDHGSALESTWSVDSSTPYFEALKHQMGLIAQGLGARLYTNPIQFTHRVITVHPLGGCPADTSEFDGVVDSFGRVHGVPGLWITDGSVLPGPVGANPSLTIAAFARRAAHKLLEEDVANEPSAPERFRTRG